MIVFFSTVLSLLFWPLVGLLAVWIGYLMLLTLCAWFAPRSTRLPANPKNRFAVLIPAHNEEKLLPDLLASLRKLGYPAEKYAVHVVADNCSDQTAQVAEDGGAIAHVRFNTVEIGKGYALQWLFEKLEDEGHDFDAAVILDADSIVSPNFLNVMDAKLQEGAEAIQAYYAVRDADRSWAVGLRSAALSVLHYLRPQGRTVLGLSVGLKGNGMVFSRELLARNQWSASLTEDIEFHMSLVLTGAKVAFAPDATVWAEIPTTLADSNTQNARWEQGRLELAKAYVPTLVKNSLFPARKEKELSRTVLFDCAMEHLIPPFSVVLGVNLLVILVALARLFVTGQWSNLYIALAFFFMQVLYLFSGMILTKTPLSVYRAILFVPAFLCWKIWLYVKVLIKPDQGEWTRTKRVGEQL